MKVLIVSANTLAASPTGPAKMPAVITEPRPRTVILSITGGYLWLAPYLSKWHESRQAVASQSHSPHVAHN